MNIHKKTREFKTRMAKILIYVCDGHIFVAIHQEPEKFEEFIATTIDRKNAEILGKQIASAKKCHNYLLINGLPTSGGSNDNLSTELLSAFVGQMVT